MILITKNLAAMSGSAKDLFRQICQGAASLRDRLAEHTQLTREGATATLMAALAVALESEQEEEHGRPQGSPLHKDESGPKGPTSLRGIFYDPEDRVWRVSDKDGLWVYSSESLEKAMLYAREVELWH